MPIPKSKEELLFQIQKNYQKIQDDLKKIPSAKSKNIGIEGNLKGTQVSPADVVAYLVGWGELVLKWQDRKSNNLAVDFPETGFKWTELGLLAQKFHQDYQEDSYDNLLSQLDDVVERITALIHSLSNHDLYEIPWYEKWTLGRMIQLNTSSPYFSNRTKIRRWMRKEGLL
jgi:hypothetical protein